MLLTLVLSLVCASSTALDLRGVRTIGTGMSQAQLNATEQVLFEHSLAGVNDTGVMNHFWAGGSPSVDGAIIRYYIDGEASPSIEYVVSMACGVGPWGPSPTRVSSPSWSVSPRVSEDFCDGAFGSCPDFPLATQVYQVAV